MANQVNWTEHSRNTFLIESGLMWKSEHESQKSRELIITFKMRVSDKTDAEIAEYLHCEESTIDNYIRELKNIYDDIVFYTHRLIPRTNLTKKDKDILHPIMIYLKIQ